MKQINDAFGHAAGDNVIQLAGEFLKSYFSEEDIVARVGGDEFIVLVKSSGAMSLFNVCDAVSAYFVTKSQENDLPYPVSVSVGACHLSEDSIDEIDDLIQKADKMLYENKKRRKLSVD